MTGEPLSILQIIDRLQVLVNHARAVEFAIIGSGMDRDVRAAMTELTMQHHDQLKALLDELNEQRMAALKETQK